MNEKINAQLQEGEKLLWTGEPEFVPMGNTHKSFYIAKVVVVLAAMAAFMAYYLKIVSTGQVEFNTMIVVIMAALAAVLLALEWVDAGKMKKTVYGITDRRLISVVETAVHTVSYDMIKDYKFDTDKDGQVSLVIGKSAMAANARSHRTNAVFGTRMTDDGTACERFVFYAIPEADKVKELMKKYAA